jgi:hypothetical protein
MRRALVMTAVLFCGALIMPAATAVGAELEGVTMPDTVTIDGTDLVLNGMGLRKKLWVEVYVAGLYLPERTSDPRAAIEADGPKKVVMHFLTDKATKSKMDDAWREGFDANSPETRQSLRRAIETFVDFFGDMKEGDVIELTMVPGVGTTAMLNGTEVGVIPRDDFAPALLSVWLGPAPPTEDLKEGMLGG